MSITISNVKISFYLMKHMKTGSGVTQNLWSPVLLKSYGI